jgi:hypothetical protein
MRRATTRLVAVAADRARHPLFAFSQNVQVTREHIGRIEAA